MRWRRWSILLLVPLMASWMPAATHDASENAPATRGAQAGATLSADDPEGDAWYVSESSLRDHAEHQCVAAGFFGVYHPTSLPHWYYPCGYVDYAEDAAPGTGVGVTPAPPALDLTGLSVLESETFLAIELELAEVSPDLDSFIAAKPHEWNALWVIWDWEDPQDGAFVPIEYVHLLPVRGATGVDVSATLTTYNSQAWGPFVQTVAIDYEIVPGTPGKVRFLVPRELMGNAAMNATLDRFYGWVDRGEYPVRPAPRVDWYTREQNVVGYPIDPQNPTAGPQNVPPAVAAGVVQTEYRYRVDWIDAAGEFRFKGEGTRPPHPPGPWVFPDPAGDVAVPAPEVDILSTEVIETPESLTIATQVAAVAQTPMDHSFFLHFRSQMSRSYFIEFDARGGQREPVAAWASFTGDLRYVPVTSEIRPGAPGWINVTFDRADLDASMRAGNRTMHAFTSMRAMDHYVARGVPQGTPAAVTVQHQAQGASDDTWTLPTIWFEHDPQPLIVRHGINTLDELYDAEEPTELTSAGVTRVPLDIGEVIIEGQGEDQYRVVLGLRASSPGDFQVPDGYDSVDFLVGLGTPRGLSNVGLHVSQAGNVESYCAKQDFGVFRAWNEVLDNPAKSKLYWIPVEKEVLRSKALVTIQWTVPGACFHQDGGGAIEGNQVGAATLMVQTNAVPASEPVVIRPDEVRVSEDFVLDFDRRAVDIEGARTLGANGVDAGAFPLWAWGLFALAAAAVLGVGGFVARHRPPPTTVLERFRVERELGRGTSGRALLAQDLVLGRRVVLKQFAVPWLADASARSAFMKEARLIAQLQHPNVITVHDVLVDDKNPTLVLEYVDGGSLRDRLEKGKRLPPQEAVRLGLEVLAGLRQVHDAGIVHRDVKPANILVDADGHAKLTDFGIARPPKDLALTSTWTRGAAQPGSLLYMSPEQVRGDHVDARTDLYAVGATLYTMLTGDHYLDLEGRSEGEVRRLIEAGPRRLPAKHVPSRLEPILRRALATDLKDRYLTAEEMANALEGALEPSRGRSDAQP